MQDRDFFAFGVSEGLSHDNVRSVLHARDGAAWLTMGGGGVNRIHQGRISSIRETDGLPSDEASSIYEDQDGTIWVGTYTGGVARLSGERIETWGVESGLPSVDIRALFRDSQGTLWAGTRSGLARFTGEGFEAVRDPGAPPDGVLAILEDRSGTLSSEGVTSDSLMTAADAALYRAKREGRNRVCCQGDP